jgi:ribosomal protein L28
VAQITVVEELVGNKVVAVIARAKHRKRTVVIGQTKVSLEPGQKKNVTVHLNAAGLKLLDGHAKLKVLFTVTAKSRKLVSRTLTLKRPKKRRHR